MIEQLKKSLRGLDRREEEARTRGATEEELNRFLDEREDLNARLAAYERLARLSQGLE